MKEYKILTEKPMEAIGVTEILFNTENKELAYDLYADYILDNYGVRIPDYKNAEYYRIGIGGTESTFTILQKVYYFRGTDKILALDDDGIKKYYDRTYAEYDRKDECTREEWQDCDTDVASAYVIADDNLQVGDFAIFYN